MKSAEKPIHSFVPVADEAPWWTEIENLKRERDEALEEMAKWHHMAIEADKRFVESVLVRDEESKKSRREHDLANEAIATWQKTRDERDALQEQLDAAIMLGKMQERRHERELAEARGESFQVQAWKQLTEQHRNEMRGL